MGYGYIKLYRQIQENEIYFQEPFNRTLAWIDLILSANHKAKTIMIRGIEIKLKRGQLAYSKLTLADRWQRNRKTIDRWLTEFKKRKMVDTKTNNVTTIITIINYDKYQEALDTRRDTKVPTKRDTTNNDKNKEKETNKEKEVFILPSWIPENLWQDYLDMRKLIKKPMTLKAKELAVKKLLILKDQNHNTAKVLEQSISNSWQGLFPLKDKTETDRSWQYEQ